MVKGFRGSGLRYRGYITVRSLGFRGLGVRV